MTKDDALKLALDALETELSIDWGNPDDFDTSVEKMHKAITAIKEALALQALHDENERLGLYKDAYAEQEQEPVGKLQEPAAERAWFTIAELNAWADKKLSENPHWVMPKDEPERKEALAQTQEPVAWRELCRRLYVELFHCDQQMMAALDEEGNPMWWQGATVRDVLADAKTALETPPPQPEQEQEPKAWRTFDGEGGYDYCSYEDNESYADDWNKRNPNHKGWVDKLYTKEKNT